MTLKFVDSVPEKKPPNHKGRRLDYNKVLQLLGDFKDDHRKIAIIQCNAFERYKNSRSLANCVRRAIHDGAYQMHVCVRGEEVYLVKD